MTKNLKAEYEKAAGLSWPAAKYVSQGWEEISAGATLWSEGFTRCSGLILVNASDGVALVKHVGPRTCFDDGGGTEFQKPYALFLEHAQKYGQKIAVMSLHGSNSHYHNHLVEQLKRDALKRGITVDISEPVKVNSKDWGWNLLYNQSEGYVLTKNKQEIHREIETVYEKHMLPSLEPEKFQESAQEMQKILEDLRDKGKIKDRIDHCIVLGEYTELEEILKGAQDRWGAEKLSTVLHTEKLRDWRNKTALDTCQERIKNRNDTPAENILRCMDLLSLFEFQDDRTYRRYADVYLELLESHAEEILNDLISGYVKPLIDKISEPRLKKILLDNFNEITETRNRARAKDVESCRAYLGSIGKGLADGHTPQNLTDFLEKKRVTLAEIGATTADVERAFTRGALLQSARRTLSDYGFAKITKNEFNCAVAAYDQNDLGVEIVRDLELTPQSMAWYEKRYNDAVSKGPK